MKKSLLLLASLLAVCAADHTNIIQHGTTSGTLLSFSDTTFTNSYYPTNVTIRFGPLIKNILIQSDKFMDIKVYEELETLKWTDEYITLPKKWVTTKIEKVTKLRYSTSNETTTITLSRELVSNTIKKFRKEVQTNWVEIP